MIKTMQPIFLNWGKTLLKILSGGLMLIGMSLLVISLRVKEKVLLFDNGIACIAIGIAFISVLFGFININDMREIKKQLNRIEKK
jgi:uncharacterized membrane protein YecN with MAPEG domain